MLCSQAYQAHTRKNGGRCRLQNESSPLRQRKVLQHFEALTRQYSSMTSTSFSFSPSHCIIVSMGHRHSWLRVRVPNQIRFRMVSAHASIRERNNNVEARPALAVRIWFVQEEFRRCLLYFAMFCDTGWQNRLPVHGHGESVFGGRHLPFAMLCSTGRDGSRVQRFDDIFFNVACSWVLSIC